MIYVTGRAPSMLGDRHHATSMLHKHATCSILANSENFCFDRKGLNAAVSFESTSSSEFACSQFQLASSFPMSGVSHRGPAPGFDGVGKVHFRFKPKPPPRGHRKLAVIVYALLFSCMRFPSLGQDLSWKTAMLFHSYVTLYVSAINWSLCWPVASRLSTDKALMQTVMCTWPERICQP